MEINSTTAQSSIIDAEEIIRTLKVFHDPAQITEIRVLNATTPSLKLPHTRSGYFDAEHIDWVPSELVTITSASGIYFTPNPVKPCLLARASNRIKLADRGETTSDAEITHRHWLLVDIDPKRSAGISSSDDEHNAAEAKGREIMAALSDEGWPMPIFADSGNGFHLVYRIDLPTDDGGLVEGVLKALAERFDNAIVKIDTCVANPARIWKLYGTLSAKGDATPDRPHRMSKLVQVPDAPTPVPQEKLEELAARLPAPTPAPSRPQAHCTPHPEKSFDLDSWIEKHDLVGRFGLEAEWRPWRANEGANGQIRIFKTCPWNEAHTNGSAFLIRMPNGAISAGCHHEGCADKNWYALRDLLEPGWQEARHDDEDGDGEVRARPADILVRLVLEENVELFHSPGSDSDAYISIPRSDHKETILLSSRRVKRWLGKLYYQHTKTCPPTKVIEDAIAALSGHANFGATEYPVAVRRAVHEGHIIIDLGDETFQAVDVDASGWKVGVSPVRFLRPRGMLPLPMPERGGHVSEWRTTINVSDAEWPLLITAVLAMLRPGRPTPIIQIQGEQGSAKSSGCSQIRDLLDPNVAPLRAEPRDVRDLIISANNSGVLAFDNISSVPPWLSDAFCRLATGGGFATRQLYGDTDEVIFNVMCPVIINGITDLSARSDLLDRMATITFPTIHESKRRTEEDVIAEFQALRPRLFGALLDALSDAMRRLPDTHVDNLPRMADFARFGVAAEAALGLPAGSFLSVYKTNREASHAIALEATPIAQALITFMTVKPSWTGVSSELLACLEMTGGVPEKQRRGRTWPNSSRQLTDMLKRIAPNLRAKGLIVKLGEHRRDGINIDIQWDQAALPPDASPKGGLQAIPH